VCDAKGELRAHTDIQQLLKQGRMIVTSKPGLTPAFNRSAVLGSLISSSPKNAIEHQQWLHQHIFFAAATRQTPHFQPSAPNSLMRFSVVANRDQSRDSRDSTSWINRIGGAGYQPAPPILEGGIDDQFRRPARPKRHNISPVTTKILDARLYDRGHLWRVLRALTFNARVVRRSVSLSGRIKKRRRPTRSQR
jgi:hypothetical protein